MVASYSTHSLDPTIWGPSMWMFLHTTAMTYPHHPNAVTKKKYYEFLQNIPLFIPVEEMSSYFSQLMDKYPVSPYLDNRESLIRWMHFIHNKINQKLEKKQITLEEFYASYYRAYQSKQETNQEYRKWKRILVYLTIFFSIGGLIYYLYDK
jgi:hypothetical protein